MNFYKDVIIQSPKFQNVNRVSDLDLLEPTTRSLVQAIIADSKAMGIQVMAFETFRSQARQRSLFAQGATQLRDVGVHNYGLACDIVRVVEGEASWKGSFAFLGQLARHYKLIWGGDWGNPTIPHSFVDAVHVQRCSIGRQGQLFRGEWYPDERYNPYHDSV